MKFVAMLHFLHIDKLHHKINIENKSLHRRLTVVVLLQQPCL